MGAVGQAQDGGVIARAVLAFVALKVVVDANLVSVRLVTLVGASDVLQNSRRSQSDGLIRSSVADSHVALASVVEGNGTGELDTGGVNRTVVSESDHGRVGARSDGGNSGAEGESEDRELGHSEE